MVDTTWPMALASAGASNGTRALAVSGPPEANILWRWMGVRAVPHLPCRFDCPATVELARRFLDVGREAGYREEMDWLVEILGWPVEWSALHGIAEVRTPILKVSTRTDATPSPTWCGGPPTRTPPRGRAASASRTRRRLGPASRRARAFDAEWRRPFPWWSPVPGP